MSSICILGRQPAIGLAELESLYGSAVKPVGKEAALLDLAPENIQFNRLGGTIKLCRVLTSLATTDWQEIQDYLVKTVPDHLQYLPPGKLQLGLSAYGFTVSSQKMQASGLTLKKRIRAHDRSVRLVPNQEAALSSAQVLHNHLTGELGWELILIKNGSETILAQTTSVQDINAYAVRDQARPKRDARVGMLPPKLAQIIINLACGQREPIKNNQQSTLLDPFCGTGVMLQEATLMGYGIYGTDIEPRMVDYSQINLEWILRKYALTTITNIEVGDATNHKWDKFDIIATETYLGRPFSAAPKPEILSEVIQDVDTIHKKYLQNVAQQTKSGFRMCLAVPAWNMPDGFKHLPVLDSLEKLGYTRISFVHAKNDDLIYCRPGQVVGRELVVLQRK